MINFLCMAFITVVVIGFGVRIFMYAKTGNPAYKHDYLVWWKK